ncbi:hypothetical protein Tco_1304273 [Tanacetum coccineum]
MDAGVSSASKQSTVIHFRIPQRRSTRLTPPTLVPTVDKADEMILQDTLQVSLAEHKSQEEQEARENVELVNEHLASVEIEKMVEGPENVIDDSSIPRNGDQNILGTRLKPMSDKESSEVEITNDEEVEITNVVIHVNANEEENTEKLQELTVTDTTLTPLSSSLNTKLSTINDSIIIKQTVKTFDTLADHLQEVMVESLPTMVDKHIKEQVEKQVPKQIQNVIDTNISSLVDESIRSYMSGHILHVHPAQPQTTSVQEQQYQLYLLMKVGPQLQQQDIAIWLALQMKFKTLQNSTKRQKTSEYEAHVTGESSGQVNEKEQGIEKHKMFSIIYEPVHGIIYKNSKKEKRVMRHSEIHKFCDATLNRVLEGLKSYNNDVNEIEVSQPDEKMGDVIRDKKGAENLAADHLSRLENPHQGDLVGMEMNDNFPHESLNMISLNPDNEPPWFTDIANYLVGNIIQRCVDGQELWIFSKLATMVPPGDIMARTTPLRKFLTPVFSGPPYIAMPMIWSHIVTHVNVREKSHRGTKCPKILFRFVRSLTYRASTLWARSRLREGTDIYSWLSTMFLNGLKRKRSPLMMPELL